MPLKAKASCKFICPNFENRYFITAFQGIASDRITVDNLEGAGLRSVFTPSSSAIGPNPKADNQGPVEAGLLLQTRSVTLAHNSRGYAAAAVRRAPANCTCFLTQVHGRKRECQYEFRRGNMNTVGLR